MVVCAMQSFATGEQLSICSSMESTGQQATQIKDAPAGIIDNGNGVEEEDREEGEIVDDFEMIISSEDEEFKLRARIQQLEDKSKDIEKMNMLSANLASQYNYQNPQRIDRYTSYQHFSPISVLSDVSSISEEDFEPSKKHRRHKNSKRSTENKRHHVPVLRHHPLERHSKSKEQQHQQLRKKRRHGYHNNNNNNNHYYEQHSRSHHQPILLDSYDSLTDDEIGEYDLNVEDDNDDYEHLEQLKLSRNKLLIALARTNYDKPKHSLKERLLYRMGKSPSPKPRDRREQERNALPPNSFEGYSRQLGNNVEQAEEAEEEEQIAQQKQEEQLEDTSEPEIKLRLIALKSAILKKHMARKKRDAERAYSPTDMINRVHQPTISNDVDDLMEISPAASPERTTYSPPSALFEPVDMDLAQTDSEDEVKPEWSNHGQRWMGSCCLPNALPPVSMPIVIDDDDEDEPEPEPAHTKRRRVTFQGDDVEDDEVPPPPPPFHIPHMQLEDDDARDGLHYSRALSPVQDSLSDIQSISMDNSQTQREASRTFQVETSDDEAGALRAMLLAKLKSTATTTAPTAPPAPSVKVKVPAAKADDSDDPEELRLLLLSSIASKKKSTTVEEEGIAEEQILPERQPSPQPVPPVAPQVVPAPEPTSTVQQPVVPAPLPTSVVTTSDIIKIVKPNKVINQKTAIKRKTISKSQSPAPPPTKRPSTLMVKETMAPLHLHNSSSTTRLITTVDAASIKVNRLVITLGESSAGSDDELELGSCYETFLGYAEQASPLSQALDSASNSTTRSNTPTREIQESTTPQNNSNLRRAVINEFFEKKIDDFLKQARSKVSVPSPLTTSNSSSGSSSRNRLPEVIAAKTQEPEQKDQVKPAVQPAAKLPQRAKPTPQAVRHLPVSTQKEYLRLVERMQVLEWRKTKTSSKPKTASPTSQSNKANNGASTAKTDAVKEVPTTSSDAKQPTKESRLKAYENSFQKIGGSMITNLDKSLRMVEEAKRAKITRLRHAQRLQELYAEMQVVRQAMKSEESKLSQIQPEIQASHEIIISLKQKRIKLRNAALELGNGLQGPNYRLLDPGKPEIMRKSAQLTKEIRSYNSIAKYQDALQLSQEKQQAEETASQTEVETQQELNSKAEQLEKSTAVTEDLPTASSAEEPAQLDDDAKPKDAAKQGSATGHKLQQEVPPYTVSLLRDLCEEPAPNKDAIFGEYRTPMSRNYNSQLNVHATICPFELMGRCEDNDCSYLHLERATQADATVST